VGFDPRSGELVQATPVPITSIFVRRSECDLVRHRAGTLGRGQLGDPCFQKDISAPSTPPQISLHRKANLRLLPTNASAPSAPELDTRFVLSPMKVDSSP